MSITQELKKKAIEERETRFDKFWNLHPARNGRKIGKPEASRKFFSLSDKDSLLILQATKIYRESKDVKDRIGIRDPHRFIRDGKGYEIWREFIPVKSIKTPQSKPLTPEEIADTTRRFSQEYQLKLYRKICDLWSRSKKLRLLNNAPCNMF